MCLRLFLGFTDENGKLDLPPDEEKLPAAQQEQIQVMCVGVDVGSAPFLVYETQGALMQQHRISALINCIDVNRLKAKMKSQPNVLVWCPPPLMKTYSFLKEVLECLLLRIVE